MKLKNTILRICAAVIGGALLLGSAACSAGQNDMNQNVNAAQQISSYRDIPDLTADEIASIDALVSTRQSFIYGAISSATAFKLPDGSVAGFTPLLCEKLSDLFGIPFELQILDWSQLHEGIVGHTIDFTGDINMPADMTSSYFHTSPVAGNRLSVFTNSARPEIDVASEYDLRGLKIGFHTQSYTEQIVRNTFPRVDFESVPIGSADEMAQKLSTGEIDAFIFDTSGIFASIEYDHVKKAVDFPLVYIPLTVTTANPNLQPVISAITKYLMAGGIGEIEQLYDTGEHEYAAHAIRQTLTDEERAYIDNLRATGTKIPVGATTTRYPVAYFDRQTKEFKGIAIDVLDEISNLTGIEFYYNCDESTTWRELEEMLRTGEIAVLSQLVPNEPRREYAIWPDTPYFTARYALLSSIDYPFLSIDQVPYATVGYSAGTAEETKFKQWFPESTNHVALGSNDEGLAALENGEIDLFFCLDYTMLYESNYRENPHQKINILFDEPIEPVPFGLNINETILCSIISKAQNIINTDQIARNWTSRIVDTSVQEAERLSNLYRVFAICMLALLGAMSMLFMRGQRLKRKVEKQVQATLEANRNMEVLLDMAPTAIIISRRGDGTILYANKAGLDMFGCKSFEEDAKGRKSFEFMPEFQPDGVKSRDVIAKLWSKDKGVSEIQFIRKNGEAFPARVAFSFINYNSNIASINVVEDMTAERRYQQRLKDIAFKEQEANQLKSQFLATMSHEIRTPMNAIIGMTDIALRETEPDVKNNHILTIKQAGDNLLSLISDILDFSKIEAGKMEIITTGYSLDSLINDVVSIIRMKVVGSPVRFTVRADSAIPRMLYGDVTRVRQAVLNILNNAVKYTEHGEVSLNVGMQPLGDEADVSTEAQKHKIKTVNLIFKVADSGVGIKEEDMSKLFDNFTQLDADKNHAVEGVGLGLAITQKIIDAMDGKIEVESEYGVGSVFTVTIPQVYYMREPLAAIDSPKQKNVLLYKLDEAHYESIIYALDNLGVSHTTVRDDDDLLEKLGSGQFNYLFISFSLYSKNITTVSKFDEQVVVAVLAEFGEASPDKNVNMLTMPVYCTAIADVLNGIYDDTRHYVSGEASNRFTAPDVRVLVVDDIYTNLKVAEGLLTPYNMHVDMCNGGAAAVEAVRNAEENGGRYDMVFMDHKMPEVDGVEATRRIRALGESDVYYRDLPIIALTANAVSGVMEMLMENGFSDYLSKPIDTTKLNAVLERWIPKYKREG